MNSIGLTDNGTALIGQGQGDSRAERQHVAARRLIPVRLINAVIEALNFAM